MPLWDRLRQFWSMRLDALGIELARGRRLRRHPNTDAKQPEVPETIEEDNR